MKSHRKTSALHRCILETLESRQMFAAGALDTTFSLDGKTGIGLNGHATTDDVAVQSDGKSVVVGTFEDISGIGRPRTLAVTRLNADGTADRTFGTTGDGRMIMGPGWLPGSAVAIQRDGGIVVVGTGATHQFAVMRIRPDGKRDFSFGNRGSVDITVKGASFAEDVAIQPDGKIVVVGSDFNSGGFLSFGDSDFAIARLNRDGSLDKSFAGDGTRIIGMGEEEHAKAVAIDTNGTPSTNPNFGKIVLAGERTNGDGLQQYALARLNPDGGLDTTFDDDGTLATRFKGYSKAFVNGVVIQPNGTVVVVGNATDGIHTDNTPIAVVRYLPNGHIDRSFGGTGSGTATIDFGGKDIGGDVMLSTGGGLIVAGTTDGKFALAALTTDGVLDTRFGTEGKVVTDFGRGNAATLVAMAASPHKRITVTGGDQVNGFQVARYLDFGAFVLADKIDPSKLPQLTVAPGTGTTATNPKLAGTIFSQLRI